MIECRSIHQSYGTIKVLKGITVRIETGESFALIGPNGAGKTTLFKVLTGEVPANSGTIHMDGRDITSLDASARVHLGVGRTFQVARIMSSNTVSENLIIAIEARMRSRHEPQPFRLSPSPSVVEEAEAMALRLGLENKLQDPASFLSHGDRKRLELGITLSLKPRILMMDEPTAGMSSADRSSTIDMILRLREEDSLTMMLTEHDMEVVSNLCDRVMVMNYGEQVAVGTFAEIQQNSAVREIYLGEEEFDLA